MEGKKTGIGLCGVLTIVFVVLKLTGLVHWSWWLVLFPVWGPIAGWTILAVMLMLLAKLL